MVDTTPTKDEQRAFIMAKCLMGISDLNRIEQNKKDRPKKLLAAMFSRVVEIVIALVLFRLFFCH